MLKKHSLRVKLAAAFALVALLLFLLTGLFVNLILRQQFEEYTISRLQKNGGVYRYVHYRQISDLGRHLERAGPAEYRDGRARRGP